MRPRFSAPKVDESRGLSLRQKGQGFRWDQGSENSGVSSSGLGAF